MGVSERTLSFFRAKKPTDTQLASLDQKDNDLKFIKTFWGAINNENEWIYITQAMISECCSGPTFYKKTKSDLVKISKDEFIEKCTYVSEEELKNIKQNSRNRRFYKIATQAFDKTILSFKKTRDNYKILKEMVKLPAQDTKDISHKTIPETLNDSQKTDQELSSILNPIEVCDRAIEQGENLNKSDLAKICNLTNEEKNYMELFWDYTFNSSWFYLSEEIIKKYLGYASLSQYYGIIRINCKEGQEYKKVNFSHELVQEYYRKLRPEGGSLSSPKKKHHYIITGSAFKKSIMKSQTKIGDKVREYYLKIETLSMAMQLYISRVSAIKKEKLLENLLISNTGFKEELIEIKVGNEVQEYVYIMSSKRDAIQGYFKVGKANDVKSRLSSANTNSPEGARVQLLKEYKVPNSYIFEKIVHNHIKAYRSGANKRKEFFKIDFDRLVRIIDHVYRLHQQANRFCHREYTEFIETKNSDPTRYNYLGSLDMDAFQPKILKKQFNISDLSEDIIDESIIEVINKCGQRFNSKFILGETPCELRWKEFKKELLAIFNVKDVNLLKVNTIFKPPLRALINNQKNNLKMLWRK